MKKPRQEVVELEPDAWKRFERAVDVVAKSPPQHRVKEQPKQKGHKSGKPPLPKPQIRPKGK